MVFQLTDSLADKILQALENQEQRFLVDAAREALVPADSAGADDDLFYALPEWNSADGFGLMEEFVEGLRAPLAKDRLHIVLHSGRGVFRGFKDELKEFPEVEKLWRRFKNQKMQVYIGGWYNELREIWGLEALDVSPEDTDDLVSNDFVFLEYSLEMSSTLVREILSAASSAFGGGPEQVRDAVSDLWQRNFLYGDSLGQTGIVCRTLSGEFAGCITAAPASRRTEGTVFLTSFFVPPQFRGLGIGTELLERHRAALLSSGKEWILLSFAMAQDSVGPLLLRSGFEKTDSGFMAKIR